MIRLVIERMAGETMMKKTYERPTLAKRDALNKIAGVVKTSNKKDLP